jgi:hypothetical protein
MSEILHGKAAEKQKALREHRIDICKRLFAAYAVVGEARRNPWLRAYCEAKLAVSDGDAFPEAVSQMWEDPRFQYSTSGLFDKKESAELTRDEQEMVQFVQTAVLFTRARDEACQPLAEAILKNE